MDHTKRALIEPQSSATQAYAQGQCVLSAVPPAVPSHPTCHRTGAAPLDGVIWQPGAIGWEPEQNQKAPCNQGSTQDLTTPPVSGTEASLRSRLSSLPPIRLFLLPPPRANLLSLSQLYPSCLPTPRTNLSPGALCCCQYLM